MHKETRERSDVSPLLTQSLPVIPALDFVEFLPVAAYACSKDGRILWYNKRAANLWGRAPRVGDASELYCGSHRLIFNGREIDRDETPMAHVLRTGEAIDGAEGIVIRPDASRVRAMVHIAPMRDNAGNVVGAINCFHDVTERERLGQALRARQDEIEDFFENGSMPLHIVSAEGIILRANKAELAMLGYRPDEYIGQPITSFHADAETIGDILLTLSACRRLDRRPARLKAKDGSIRHVLITSSPRVEDGQFVNTRCFTEDVTAQVEAQRRIANTEDRYRALLEAVPAAIYTTDAQGVITYFNEHARQMAGTTPEIGRTQWCVSYRLYDADGKPLPLDECPMAVALRENRAVRNVEILVERPDGTMVPVLPHPTPLHDENGRLVGAVNMLVDISDRKQAEHRQITLLRELNHRVKNNLQLLQALLSSAHRSSRNAEAKSVLGDAVRRVETMAAAQRVLHGEASPAHVEARRFLEAVCESTRSALPVDVPIEIDTAVGQLNNDAAMPLALILNELLTNAVKHGLGKDNAGSIRIGLQEEADEVRLWVKDCGPGFEVDPKTANRYGGIGLVHGLSRQLRGTFSVECTGGAICTVRFRQDDAGDKPR
jgi:PAS domain S-box-containing protein